MQCVYWKTPTSTGRGKSTKKVHVNQLKPCFSNTELLDNLRDRGRRPTTAGGVVALVQ
ncbi:hypothetical protein RDWZM_005417 [Blomia tropicalis]|uniref:Uncharacterized protein n=1 Tax=Blomia tropicalis TaxID=40697 RepID=A0A9Q0M9H2_BLOTA|nr:hypothetical protein RDWZM_005417 [Blomia tropicalis]